MILIGQYDSPFVRRVGIALRLYGLPYRHEPWSAVRDADRLRAVSPLTRVPTLVLDDGTALADSHLILAYLDGLVGADRALWPAGEARVEAVALTGLATGVADKAVSLFYEVRMHAEVSQMWYGRCLRQVQDGLTELEAAFARRSTPCLFGDAPTHADIAAAAMLRFVAEAHAARVPLGPWPALRAFSARMEETPVFRDVSQPFIAPA